MNSTENLGLTLFESDDKFRISQETQSLNKNMKVLDEEIPKKAKTDIIAQKFNPENANGAGSYVVYEGELYILPEGHEANVTWENTSKTKIMLADEVAKKYEKPVNGIPAADLATGVIPDVSGKANLSVIAPAFAEATDNVAGSLVTYTDGVIYLLPEGHEAGITWGNTVKTATNIAAELTHVKSDFHGNINNDTALKNYSNGAYDTGKNIAPMMTFVDDDNDKRFADFWPDIISAKEIPVSIAVIVGKVGTQNYGTWDDLKDYHDNYGVEVVCHSYSHITTDSDYDNMTVDEIAENEFARAKRVLEEHGYKTDFLFYPGHTGDIPKVRIAASRVFPVAVLAGGNRVNTTPLQQHKIARYSIDSGSETIDYDTVKAYIDEAISKNAWLIFMCHSQNESMTSASAQVIESLIDYARSSGVDIVSMREGYARFRNVVNIENENVDAYGLKIGADGKVQSGVGIGIGIAQSQIHNFYSKLDSYDDYNVTTERVEVGEKAKLFPRSAYGGILKSYRNESRLVQHWMPFGYQELWVRQISGNTLPGAFTCQSVPSGTYENRNSLAYERKGNCYYDETNNRPIFCKTVGSRSVDEVVITHGASASGNIKIGSKEVAVEVGDTPEQIAEKIVNISYPGFNILQCAENRAVVYITRSLAASVSAITFSDIGSTGVTATVTRKVDGVAAEWVDASGNAL